MTKSGINHEQQQLLQGFIEEGRELLDEVEPLLIELEKTADESGELDGEVINTIFRLFHSLKGSAGFLELNTLGRVTHVAQDTAGPLQKGRRGSRQRTYRPVESNL